MRVYTALLTGAFSISIVFAQSSGLVTQTTSTQDAADVRREQQLQLESLISNAENDANRQKLELQNQYAALQVQLTKCGTDKTISNIQAEKDAENKKVDAMQNSLQSGLGGVAPLIQGGFGLTELGTTKAEEEIKQAVTGYNDVNSKSFSGEKTTHSGGTSSTKEVFSDPSCKTQALKSDGSNVSQVLAQAKKLRIQNMTGGVSANPGCYKKMSLLETEAESAKSTIDSAEKQKGKMKESVGSLIAGATQLGLAVYGNNVAKKGAESDVNFSKQMGDIGYQACADGIKSQAEAIQRQIDAINAQLASDIDRLRKQFAAKRVDIKPNDSNGLPVANDTNVEVSELSGGGIPASSLKSKNPFAQNNNNNKKNLSGSGFNSGGSGGLGGGLGGDSGGVGWDFGNPNSGDNPDSYRGLPQQPDSGSLASGNGEGNGSIPSGENPFGDPLMPAEEDAFANVGPESAKQSVSYGNGFMELARQTHRRVYAHLGELLGGTGSPQITKKENKNPERTITSTKN